MATVVNKPMTAEEFYEWTHRPENRDRRFELERGEIIEVSRPGKQHGLICANIAGVLWTFAKRRKKGYVCSNDVLPEFRCKVAEFFNCRVSEFVSD